MAQHLNFYDFKIFQKFPKLELHLKGIEIKIDLINFEWEILKGSFFHLLLVLLK